MSTVTEPALLTPVHRYVPASAYVTEGMANSSPADNSFAVVGREPPTFVHVT